MPSSKIAETFLKALWRGRQRVLSDWVHSREAHPDQRASAKFALTESVLTEIINQDAQIAETLFEELRRSLFGELVPLRKGAIPAEQALTELVKQAQLPRGVISELLRNEQAAISALLRNEQHILNEVEKLRQAIEERKPLASTAQGAASPVPSRVHAEIDSMVDRLRGEGIEGTYQHWESLARDSEPRRVAWTKDGSLVKTHDLAQKWGRSRQALDQAVERGELFNLKIGGRRWYPAVFARLTADDVRQINLALRSSDPVSKFVFWTRLHGGLGGNTVESAIREGKLARVTELAEAWAEERGGKPLSIHAANA